MAKKTHEEYMKEVSQINPNIEVLEQYKGTSIHILHKCKIHNFTWNVIPRSILQGSGCPQCKAEKIAKKNSLTDEEYKFKLKEVNPNVISLEKYVNAKTPILHRCLIHNIEWKTTPCSTLQGCGCKQCSSERMSIKQTKTHEEYVRELEQINPNIEVLEKYTNTHNKLLFRCKIDGHTWKTGAANVLAGTGCPKCAGNPRRTQNEYIQELAEVNPNIEVIGIYSTSMSKIKHRCKIHDYIWDGIPSTLLRGVGCPVCWREKTAKALRISHEEYIKRLFEINSNIICMGQYIDMKTPIFHKCLIHNYEWKCSPDSLIAGHGCPKCGARLSKGEEKINDWLNIHNIQFIRQKTFKDCKDKYCLPFDFYLPQYNKCIEYDGRQHFEPVDIFGGEEDYKVTVLHDQIKNKYCEDNNIPLLRIPYYADVETELSNFLLI